MITRVATLAKTSATLRRQIWASLPWEVRVADFFTRLAVSMHEAFGETVYAEFLKKGVEGMPAHKGTPAESLNPRRPPRGYGKEFGKKCYKFLLGKYKKPQLVEEIMAEFVVALLTPGSYDLRPGVNLKAAESFIFQGLKSHAFRLLNKKKEVSDVYFSDGEERRHELPSEDADSVEDQVKRQLPKMRGKLKAIHPDAEQYVVLSLIQGMTDTEIIGDIENGVPSKLDHPYNKQGQPLTIKNWNATYKPKIYDVLRNNFDYLQVSV